MRWFGAVAKSTPCGLPAAAELQAALLRIDAAPLADDDERPVFLCNVGWRSGSSLAHRLLTSDPRLLLWGEPLGRMGLVSRLASAMATVTPRWPGRRHWLGGAAASGVLDFATSNFAPDGADLRAGLRARVRTRGGTRMSRRKTPRATAESVRPAWSP